MIKRGELLLGGDVITSRTISLNYGKGKIGNTLKLLCTTIEWFNVQIDTLFKAMTFTSSEIEFETYLFTYLGGGSTWLRVRPS